MGSVTMYEARYYCTGCGREIMDWEESCSNCGDNSWQSEDMAYCANCGMSVDPCANNPRCSCFNE